MATTKKAGRRAPASRAGQPAGKKGAKGTKGTKGKSPAKNTPAKPQRGGILGEFFLKDHRRMEKLLTAAEAGGEKGAESYAEFRKVIVRHIAMEERVLIPAATKIRHGKPPLIAQTLRREHGALVSLLVPPPGPGIYAAIRKVLVHHHDLEEGSGGLYELCSMLLGAAAEDLVREAKRIPEVPLLPHNAAPIAYEAAVRTLDRAGFHLTLEDLHGKASA